MASAAKEFVESRFGNAFLCLAGLWAAWQFAGWRTDGCEPAVRSAGGILQLLGAGLVVWQIRARWQSYDRTEVIEGLVMEAIAAGQWTAKKLESLRHRRGSVMVTGAGRIAAIGTRARAIVRPAKDATLEERVAFLERSRVRFEEVVDRLDQRLDAEQKARTVAVEAERRGWTDAVEEIGGRVRSLTIGSIRREVVGVVWLVAGLVLTTWSPELAPHESGPACATVSVPLTARATPGRRSEPENPA